MSRSILLSGNYSHVYEQLGAGGKMEMDFKNDHFREFREKLDFSNLYWLMSMEDSFYNYPVFW